MKTSNTVNKVDGFVYTTAIKKLRKLNKRIKKIPGGTSAGKTFGILPILIHKAAKQAHLEISVVSESIPHLRKGALKDFLKIMNRTGRYIDSHYNRTLLTYTFSNGSFIEFFSADQQDKVRGPRRNILYINECNNLKFETYHQLAIRTDLEVWLDYNPTNEFWADTELDDDDDVEELVLTYKDNEGLSESIVKEIEKALSKGFYNSELSIDKLFAEDNIKNAYWANWWKVYGLGRTGSLEGVIYSNWETIKAIPQDARLIGYGLDWGFENDPCALIACYRYDKMLIFHQLIYEKKLTNDDLIKKMNELNVANNVTIVADSAEPKSIKDLVKVGYICKASYKKQDHKSYAIQKLQGFDMWYVTEDSLDFIKELREYVWETLKDGTKTGKPQDGNDHACDAIIYLVNELLTIEGSTKAKTHKVKTQKRSKKINRDLKRML